MTTESLLLVILIIIVVGAFPAWPHSKSWGYVPTSFLTLLLVVFVIWVITADRPFVINSGDSLQSTVQDAGQDMKAAGRDVADSIRRTVQ